MAIVKRIASPKGKNLIRLYLFDQERGEFTLTVSESAYRRTGCPLTGEEIDGDSLSELSHEDEQRRADARALRLLEYADNNERMIKTKLVASGFSPDIAQESAKRMVMLGYINEARQIEILVLREANRCLRGPKRILQKLAAKGYSVTEIKSTIQALSDSGEIDFKKNAATLAKKKGVMPEGEEMKILLYKNGY